MSSPTIPCDTRKAAERIRTADPFITRKRVTPGLGPETRASRPSPTPGGGHRKRSYATQGDAHLTHLAA